MRDKSEVGEYHLDVTQGDAHNSTKKKRIPVVDIDEIEPLGQGSRFHLRYYCQQGWFSNEKTLKVELYESKYLADIMDAFEHVLPLVTESEMRLAEITEGSRDQLAN